MYMPISKLQSVVANLQKIIDAAKSRNEDYIVTDSGIRGNANFTLSSFGPNYGFVNLNAEDA